jgi:DNA helicase-2/ATP-dependent DNA helicase PcrA
MSDVIWLAGLNNAQHTAVTAPLQHLLILAGAGSGKTRVLVSRIAYLVHTQQITINEVLAVTFTNKAAGEMKSRLHDLLQHSLHDFWIGTFHSICHRLLRRHYDTAKLPQAFQILDSDDQARMIKRVMTDLQLDPEQWPVKQAQAFINGNKDEGLRPAQVLCPNFGPAKTWLKVYAAYEQACQLAGVIDFAEILLRAHELLRDNPELLAHYQSRFRTILVDEFQDTNTVQYAWIKLLAGQYAKVMVVGDDDQSIYGWRGAKVENIHKFTKDFPDAHVVRLEQNYRSSSTILQAANALIAHNPSRMGKSLWTAGHQGENIIVFSAFNELEEARFVSERVNMEYKRGCPLQDIAILYRSNAQSRVLEEAFLRAGIAYRIHGGMRFFERAEVKDALAYLRLILNRHDDNAFERIVNLPARGLGEKTLDQIRELARDQMVSLWTAATQILSLQGLTQRAGNALVSFLNLVEHLQQEIADLPLEEQMNRVINQSGLYAHYAAMKGDVAESKLQNLQELVSAAKEFRYEETDDMPYMVSFLAHASLEAGELQASEHEDSVQMMTLHAAKGLEFPCVFLVGMEEGLFPAKQSATEPGRLEEERRLCYVGMTRAMQRLILTYAEVRRQYGREEYHRPSRFLQEIPAELLDEIRHNERSVAQRSFAVPMQSKHESGWQLGQNVEHDHFGSGVILAIEGQGAHTRVQVKFGGHGTKWLVLAYANLKV